MSRTARAVTAFALGAALVLSGLTLAIFAGETSGWVIRASGRHVPSQLLQQVAMTLLAGELAVEGLARSAGSSPPATTAEAGRPGGNTR